MTSAEPISFSTGPDAPPPEPGTPSRGLAWWSVIAVLSVALLVRVVAAVAWHHTIAGGGFVFGDSDSYWTLAHALARGNEYLYGDLRVFRMPGYPLILAALMAVWPGECPILAGRIVGAALGTLSVALVVWAGWRLADIRVGVAAGALAALWPEAILSDVMILSEVAFVPPMLAQMIGLLALHDRIAHDRLASPGSTFDRRAALLALATGAASGVALLVRPSWLPFWPFLLVVIPIAVLATSPPRERWPRLRRWTVALVLMGLAQTVVISPWLVRNAVVTGRLVPTTLTTGATLYDSFRPGSDGGSDMEFVNDFRHRVGTDRIARSSGPPPTPGTPAFVAEQIAFENELDATLFRAATERAVGDPGETLRLAGWKLGRLWNVVPNHDGFRHPLAQAVILIGTVPILLLALAGAWHLVRTRPGAWVFLLPAIYTTALHAVFVSSIRYREPPTMALIVLAGGGLVWLVTRRPVRSPTADGSNPAGA